MNIFKRISGLSDGGGDLPSKCSPETRKIRAPPRSVLMNASDSRHIVRHAFDDFQIVSSDELLVRVL